ncbi:hypothetical protein [Psychrobacter phenylpyruvicus]|uniref:Uncharacterized protein n=1 Tax=Psychrobacter phenylpyruvicus TaxID=29432 RepID=A0A379LIA5_9GAMM|nr:hypothetical protein [Psychrobacter phenylpyruvicus]SUD90293.1 Uncharacterised protein [Psychrobacter phenylpyruvicus]
MEWLRNIVINLPLDEISDSVSRLTIWWSNLVADVPADMLPIYAYVGFSVIVLLLWLFIVRILPSPLGGMSWLALFSILLAPGSAAGNTGEVAPASIGVVYGILMKDPGLALRSLLPILVVFAVGLVLGFIWQMIRNIIEKSADESRQQALMDEKANMQLASANYVELVQGEAEVASEPKLTKQKREAAVQKQQMPVQKREVPVQKREVPVAKEVTTENSLQASSDTRLDKNKIDNDSTKPSAAASTLDKKDI